MSLNVAAIYSSMVAIKWSYKPHIAVEGNRKRASNTTHLQDGLYATSNILFSATLLHTWGEGGDQELDDDTCHNYNAETCKRSSQ